MPQLIFTTKQGREIVFTFQDRDVMNKVIENIVQTIIGKGSGIDVTYDDLLGKKRRLIVSDKFLHEVTISTL